MNVTTVSGIVHDYLGRVRGRADVEEVHYLDQCGCITFYTIVLGGDRARLDSLYELENELLVAHPEATLNFEVFDLSRESRAAAHSALPSGAQLLYRTTA
jgi:hypothetical protein